MLVGSVESSSVAHPAARGERHWCFRRVAQIVCIVFALTCVALGGSLAWWVISLGPAPLGNNLEFSKTVLDRDGRLLRAYATSEGRWRLPAKVASHSR